VTDFNGCTGVTSVEVVESTSLDPQIIGDTAFCSGDVLILDAGDAFETYLWNTGLNTSSISVTSGGVYSLTVTDLSGCTGETTIQIDENIQPFATVTTSADVCNTPADGSVLDFSDFVTGGELTGIWTEISGTPSGAAGSFPVLDFDGVAPDVYQFQYSTNTAVWPCQDESYVINITVRECACPNPQINPGAPICNDNGVLDVESLLQATTVTGGVWEIIAVPGGQNAATLTGTTFDAANSDPGFYEVQYTISGAPPGCPLTSTSLIEVVDAPYAGISGDPALVCIGEDSVIFLEQLILEEDQGGQWIETSQNQSTGGSFNDLFGSFNTTSQLAGTYTFEYIVSIGSPCADVSTTVEVIIEALPMADAGQDFELICAQPTISLGGPGTSTGPEFEYLWTTADGVIEDSQLQNPVVEFAGTYTLMVRNMVTGCESFDEVTILANDQLPTGIDAFVVSPPCFEDVYGTVDVLGIIGGTPPFHYTLNDNGPTTNPNFTNVLPGPYNLEVMDANGCTHDTSFTITAPQQLFSEIIGAISVEEDDTVTMNYTFGPTVPDSVVWWTDAEILCIGCEVLVFKAENSMDVFLTIYDENGCWITTSVPLFVKKARTVYVPNVFSPNGDDINDYFTLYTKADVINITDFRVFTRWGEVVFKRDEILPNVDQLGWDGKMNGEALLPGVYVYTATVNYSDGLKEVLKGDISIVR
jgi:gliding motility-associated-like protein